MTADVVSDAVFKPAMAAAVACVPVFTTAGASSPASESACIAHVRTNVISATVSTLSRLSTFEFVPQRLRRHNSPNRGDRVTLRMTQSRAVKTFEELFAELARRAQDRPAGSATVAALDAGVHTVGKKLLEEAGEVWLAAEHESDEALAGEISQLLYWTQVLMVARGLTLDDVYRKL